MTETAFQELVARSYQRLSSHQIDFISVNTKYHNQKKRRGTYYFELPLVYADEAAGSRRIICQVLFNPAFRRHFIHHTLATDPENVNTYIEELLTHKKADRNQTLLRVLDESTLQAEALTQIKQGIANAVKNIKFWNFQSGKAQYRIPELGTLYLRPLREE